MSNLIIIQVIFIFAALALILFVPESGQELGEQMASLERELVETGRLAEQFHASLCTPPARQVTVFDSLTAFFDSLQRIDHAAVLRIVDSSQIQLNYAYKRPEASTTDDSGEPDVSAFCNYSVLRMMTATREPLPPQSVMAPQHLVTYQALAGDDTGDQVVLVLAIEHDLSISPRSNLQYAILVLFLCSALVSLLTVSLLMRKFKRPIDRIIAGLGETAEGKLHNLVELENDPELGKLARAYNTMSRKLWDNRKELDAYFARLEKANSELRESQSFLSTLFDSSPLSIVVTDPAGTILMFNRAASEVFGYPAESVVGGPVTNLLAEELDRSVWDSETDDPGSFEAICRKRNGTPFPGFVITGRIETEADGLLARLYVFRDITESKNFQEMMIRLDRYYTRGEMVGDIAHEINNYLAVLLGNVELMPLLLKKGDMEKVDQKLEVMMSALEKIARFSDGLLDSPPDTVRLEPVSLNQIIENVLTFLQPQNKFDNIEVVKELSTEIPVLHVDTSQVQQLLVNLIYNAAEALAGQEGKRIIQVTTGVTEIDGQPGVKMTVKDNGPGVATEKEELLFKTRFTTKSRGHGIGLITCRKIIDNHGGDISYTRDDGALFSMLLPVRKPIAERTDAPAEAGAQPAQSY